MTDDTYSSGLENHELIFCQKDQVPFEPMQVTLSYMDAAFPVVLPACPICGMIYIPEELSSGKILHVEKSLEDK